MRISVGKSPDAPRESRHITLLICKSDGKGSKKRIKKKRERNGKRGGRDDREKRIVARFLVVGQGERHPPEGWPVEKDTSRPRDSTLENRHRPLLANPGAETPEIFFGAIVGDRRFSTDEGVLNSARSLARTTRVRDRRAVCLNARARARDTYTVRTGYAYARHDRGLGTGARWRPDF